MTQKLYRRGRLGLLAEALQSVENRQVSLAGAVLLDALSMNLDYAAVLRQRLHKSFDQSSLADPRLAGDEDKLSLAAPRNLEIVAKLLQLRRSAHEGFERIVAGDR